MQQGKIGRDMTLLIAYALNIIDYLFTSHWVNLYGLSAEGNPIGRWMFENGFAGVFKIFIVGGLMAILGICIRKKPRLAWTAFIPLVVYAVIVIYHLVIFFCL
jgi:hypothetical protein